MRSCIYCGVYEPFQDLTEECCFKRFRKLCVFPKPENAGNKKTSFDSIGLSINFTDVGERSAPESKHQKLIKEQKARLSDEEFAATPSTSMYMVPAVSRASPSTAPLAPATTMEQPEHSRPENKRQSRSSRKRYEKRKLKARLADEEQEPVPPP